MKTQYHLFFVVLIIISLNSFVATDDPLTAIDRGALKKFRPMVEHLLPHEYMKADGYLLRWIRTRKYDLDEAKELLVKSLKWRKENDIDNIQLDKTSSIGKQFKIDVDGVDKEGRPVMLVEWTGDTRKFVLAGKRKQLSRHLGSAMELIERKTRELNIHNNNTQWIGVYDWKGFSTQTHLCVQCLPTYLDHATIEESNYPLGAKEYILINAPRIFQTVLRLVGPILGDTIDRITTIGPNRKEWKAALLARIPADQLTTPFGGTRKPNYR